jgi:calcium/calmodulin-dependent protein kinase I
LIYSGAFSEVKRGISRTTGEEVAIKIMTKSKDNRKMEIIEVEIEVLKRVDHSNVIKLYEIFDNKSEIALVLQLYVVDCVRERERERESIARSCCSHCSIWHVWFRITGGELFERIVKQTRYSEADASRVVKQLLLGLAHLHERDIIHRDLKVSYRPLCVSRYRLALH